MSNIETNWVLKLIDQVTGPIKDIFNSTSKLNTEFDQTDKKVKFTGEDLKEAFSNAKTHVSNLQKKLKQAEKNLESLNKDAKTKQAEREESLLKTIGQLKVEVDFLKKASE